MAVRWLETWASLASFEYCPATLHVLDSFALSAHPRCRDFNAHGRTAPLWSDGERMTMLLCAAPSRVLRFTLPPTCEAAENDEQTSPSAPTIRFGIPRANPIATSSPPRASPLSALSAGSLTSRVPVPDPRGRRQPIRPPVPPLLPKGLRGLNPAIAHIARFDVAQSVRRRVATPPTPRLWGRLHTARRRHAGYVTGAGILLNAGNLCQHQPRAILSSSPARLHIPGVALFFCQR